MKSKVRFKGKLRSYLCWPLWLTIPMTLADVGLYFYDGLLQEQQSHSMYSSPQPSRYGIAFHCRQDPHHPGLPSSHYNCGYPLLYPPI